MKFRLLSAGVAAIALAAVIACADSTTSPSGNFTVRMTDSPFTDAKALLITFTEVSVHASGGDWVQIPFSGGATTRTCDLKKLTSAQDVLGVGALTQGHYTQVRLAIASATIYFDSPSVGNACDTSIAAPGGASAPVTVPPDKAMSDHDFDVPASGATTMLLDFHGDESVHATGNGKYNMTPTFTVVSVQ